MVDNNSDNKEFDIKEHQKRLVNDYCPNMPSEVQGKLFGRIDQAKVDKVPSFAEYPGPGDYDDAYVKDSPQHRAGAAITNELLTELTSSGSRSGNALQKLLENSKLEIRIRTKFDQPNASAAFQEGNPNKIFISVSDTMFQDENIEMFPELLAHEMVHILDKSRRSGGQSDHIDEVESVMDAVGQDMAAKAGYSSEPWGKFMGDDFEKRRQKFDYSPDGGYRQEVIHLCELANPPSHTPPKKAKDLKSYRAYKNCFKRRDESKTLRSKRIASLKGRISNKGMPREFTHPYKHPRQKTSKVYLNMLRLRMYQNKKQNG